MLLRILPGLEKRKIQSKTRDRNSIQKIDEADIVIALYDAAAALKPDFGYLLSYEEKVIYVANKMDKLSEQQKNNIMSKNICCFLLNITMAWKIWEINFWI